jgi:hypothetical protein
VFASYTLAFALKLRKKHGKISVMVVEKCPDILVAVVYPGGSELLLLLTAVQVILLLDSVGMGTQCCISIATLNTFVLLAVVFLQ